MKEKVLVLILSLLLGSLGSTSIFASSLEKRWGIGLGNPYLSMKYHASARTAYEIRAAFGSGISVYSARVYRNFTSKGKAVAFAGLEGGTISFEKKDIKGDASSGVVFVGFENPFSEKPTLFLQGVSRTIVYPPRIL